MVTAFILATTKSGKERDVLDRILKIDEIKEAYNVYGDYDIILKAEIKTLDLLNDFLMKRIRNIENIVVTTTMIGV